MINKITLFLEGIKEKENLEHIVGFLGGSEIEEDARIIVSDSLNLFKKNNLRIGVLIGGTNWGISKYAYESGKELGFPTIGIYPKRGEKYLIKDLDYCLMINSRFGESEWTDATEVFAKFPDAVEVIGGGMGTLAEFAHIMKANEGRIKYGKKPIYMAPVIGNYQKQLGFSDLISQMLLTEEHKACLPERPFYCGKNAAKFLTNKLSCS